MSAESDLWKDSLSDIFQMMPSGVVVMDSDYKVQLWNAAMERITGYMADEVLGRQCSFLNCEKCNKNMHDDADCNEIAHNVECTIASKRGESIPVLKNARILTDSPGRRIGVVEVITDLRYKKTLEKEIEAWRGTVSVSAGMGLLVGNSYKMRDVYERIRLAADTDATVLIHGDTGTGKELAANAIHMNSARRDKPFIKLNCSALTESLLESELFGHVKGAFTGAIKDKTGRFEAADGGTIFMDEIGDISPLIQLKLLRVIQERVYERVGENIPRKVDVRIIVATHRDLRELVKAGKFREDFYYRIKVFDIKMPSLNERKEDIPLLTNAFIERFRRATGRNITAVSDRVMHIFMDHCWPGNVRELENAIEHAFVTCRTEVIDVDDLPLEIRREDIRRQECNSRLNNSGLPSDRNYNVYSGNTKDDLLALLEECNWNKTEVARRLGVDRSTVWRRMKKFGIEL